MSRDAKDFVRRKLSLYKVVIFSATFCPHSKRAKTILRKYKIAPEDQHVIELDTMRDQELSQGIKEYMRRSTGNGTVPRVFVNGRFVGGADTTEKLDGSGELLEMLEDAGVEMSY